MRLLRRLFRTGRALSAVLLLTTLVVGEAADARHHLSPHGCAADSGGRNDNCTCASLHAAPMASEPIAQPAPVEHEHHFTAVAATIAPIARAARASAPRAPPRG